MPLRGRARDPTYKIELWNQYEAALNGQPRTTNACEGSHNAFGSLLNASHPSVWVLFDAIIKDAAIQKKLVMDEHSGRPAAKNRKYVELNERVKQTVTDYPNKVDKVRYLRCLALLQGQT